MADCKYLIDRANLHYVRKQASEFLCDIDFRIDNIEVILQPALLRDIIEWDGTTWSTDRRTRYIPSGYVSGQSYQRGDEVSGIGQISEAIVDGATESPFIQPTGEQAYIYEGTLVESSQTAKQIIFGNRYTWDVNGYAVGYRIYTTIGNNYRVVLITDPLGVPVVETLATFTAPVSGWNNLSLPPSIITSGDVFDLICTVSEPAPTPTTFTGNWLYNTPQNMDVPLSGDITHPRSQTDVMRINRFDDTGADRNAELSGLTIGDTINVDDISWAIQNISPLTLDYYEIAVAPAVNSSPSDIVKLFTFETVTATPITTGSDLDYWSLNPPFGVTVQGLEGVDVPYDQIVPNNTAYGTDVLVQAAYVPTEWKVKILSGTGDNQQSIQARLKSLEDQLAILTTAATNNGWVL